MPAHGTAEEPYFALISSAELAEPPDSKVVLALRALDLDRGHGVYACILIINNRDLILSTIRLACHLILVNVTNLSDIAAFPAFKLTPR